MYLAGIVILYKPDNGVFDNIATYISELDCLYVFDNTEEPDVKLVTKLKELPHVQYLSFGENKGISYALNYVLASANHYKFLLTMDQDSSFQSGMMKTYKSILENQYSTDSSVAMFSVHYEGQKKETVSNTVQVVERAITSGSIVNIDIAKKIGGFDENLFIDEVDNEFCYRAQLHGYKILYFPQIQMQHHLGIPIPGSLFGIKFKGLNHNKIRKYYITRNNIYLIKKYPKLRFYCFKELIKVFIKLFLVEPDKVDRFLYMCKGVKDALTGKMGKLKI